MRFKAAAPRFLDKEIYLRVANALRQNARRRDLLQPMEQEGVALNKLAYPEYLCVACRSPRGGAGGVLLAYPRFSRAFRKVRVP